MIRKSTLFRLLGLTFLVLAACFGTLNLTAQPAQAIYCFPTFGDCWFSHVADYGSAICCEYQCPDGSQMTGMCEPI